MFTCPLATTQDHCKITALFNYPGVELYGGVRTDDGTTLKLFIHRMQILEINWTFLYDMTYMGANYHTVKKVFFSANAYFAITEPINPPGKPLLFRFTHYNAVIPKSLIKIFEFAETVRSVIAISNRETGNSEKIYTLCRKTNGDLLINRISFGNFVLRRSQFSIFSGDPEAEIIDSFKDFVSGQGLNLRDFVIVGNTKYLQFPGIPTFQS